MSNKWSWAHQIPMKNDDFLASAAVHVTQAWKWNPFTWGVVAVRFELSTGFFVGWYIRSKSTASTVGDVSTVFQDLHQSTTSKKVASQRASDYASPGIDKFAGTRSKSRAKWTVGCLVASNGIWCDYVFSDMNIYTFVIYLLFFFPANNWLATPDDTN